MSNVVLVVRGLGPVPSFKNNKMIARGRLITNPKRQEWMKRCVDSFVSQLLCVTRIYDAGTATEHCPHCLIASSLPADDCWSIVPQITISAIKANPDMAGATITIEKL